MSDQDQDNPRRDFLRKSLTLIPVVTVASTGLGGSMLMATPEPVQAAPANARQRQSLRAKLLHG